MQFVCLFWLSTDIKMAGIAQALNNDRASGDTSAAVEDPLQDPW